MSDNMSKYNEFSLSSKPQNVNKQMLGILHSQVCTFFQNGVYYRIENQMPKLETRSRDTRDKLPFGL